MELIYKINFNSTNFYFKNIIDRLIIESEIEASTKMYRDFILLVCNDSKENIENFFLFLEEKLPLSIFLEGAEVLNNFDYKEYKELEEKDIKINLSLLTNDEIKKILEENNINFSNDINRIKEKGVSRFETHNGLKDLFLPNEYLRRDFEAKGYEVKLLITNINEISNLLEISPKDLQVICSIERPLVKLKFKPSQNLKGEFSHTRFIYAKIPDDKETVLFAQALKENGINYLLYVNDDVYQDGLKVTYTDNQNIIVHGEKGFFPKYVYGLDKQINSLKEYFDEHGSVFKATIAQYCKRLVPTIGVYFSYKSDKSAIKVNVPNIGEKDIIYIPNVVNNIDNCFEDIKSIDENTQRLIDNYKNKFPSFFENSFESKNTNSFETILNLLAYILGMRDYKEFEDTALTYNGKSGIQIDMYLIKIDDKNYLDYRRIIHSTMSYKIAGVEDSMLAYSFYESLSEFIVHNVEKINEELNSKDLFLCGDVFANSILLSKLNKNVKNMDIFIPKGYPLDY